MQPETGQISKQVAPCLSLAFELLAEIFAFVVDSYPPGDLRWTPIMLVCRQWHGAAVNSPKLWATIECHHPGWIAPLLRLSQNMPLSIWMIREKNSQRSAQPLSALQRLSMTLASSSEDMNRVQSIHIEDDSDIFHNSTVETVCNLRLPAPTLRTFHLSAERSMMNLDPFLFGGITPSLRHFALRIGLGISAKSPLLRNLTSLHLEVTSHHEPWSVEDALVVLAASPALNSLALIDVFTNRPSHTGFVYPAEVITLPLKLFSYRATKPAMQHLTRRLASSCPTVIDGTLITSEPPDFIAGDIRPSQANGSLSSLFVGLFGENIRTIGYPESTDPLTDLLATESSPTSIMDVRDLVELKLKVDPLETYSRPFLFDIVLHYPSIVRLGNLQNDAFLAQMINTCTWSQMQTVRWLFIKAKRSISYDIPEEAWRLLFVTMPQVERLSICAEKHVIECALAALSPRAGPSTHDFMAAFTVLLPNLRTLELDVEFSRDFGPRDLEKERQQFADACLSRENSLFSGLYFRSMVSAPLTSLVVSGREMPESLYQNPPTEVCFQLEP